MTPKKLAEFWFAQFTLTRDQARVVETDLHLHRVQNQPSAPSLIRLPHSKEPTTRFRHTHRIRSCGRDIPVGSCRSVSPRTHSAKASSGQWACRGCPWLVIGARPQHRRSTWAAASSTICSRGRPKFLPALRAYRQDEREGSRTSGVACFSLASGRAAAGNCSTVARWPSHRRVSSTTCPLSLPETPSG